jgi:hypothetical protein
MMGFHGYDNEYFGVRRCTSGLPWALISEHQLVLVFNSALDWIALGWGGLSPGRGLVSSASAHHAACCHASTDWNVARGYAACCDVPCCHATCYYVSCSHDARGVKIDETTITPEPCGCLLAQLHAGVNFPSSARFCSML